MAKVQLTEEDGDLYLNGQMLIMRYPEGDCDTVEWPKPEEKVAEWEKRLESALFDLREMGFWEGDEVELPDGSIFDV